GQADRGGLADAGGAAGDENVLASHELRAGHSPTPLPMRAAVGGAVYVGGTPPPAAEESADDRQVEHRAPGCAVVRLAWLDRRVRRVPDRASCPTALARLSPVLGGWCDDGGPGVSAAGVQPERWVGVGHQRGVCGHPQYPPVQAENQVVEATWVAAGDGQDDRGDEHQDADQAAGGPAVVLGVGAQGEPDASAGEDAD